MQRIMPVVLPLILAIAFAASLSALAQAPAAPGGAVGPVSPAGPAPAPAVQVPLYKAVNEAIAKTKAILLAAQQADGSWGGFAPVLDAQGKPTGKSQYPVGPTALAAYALLESGENAQSPAIKRALDWLTKQKTGKTYELGLRCSAYQVANKGTNGKYSVEMRADAKVLETSTFEGSYSYDCIGKPIPNNLGDSSNAQYGVLGVWNATRGNRTVYEASDQYWYIVMTRWLNIQNKDGGFPYVKGGPSSGTMTVAGVASLFVCYDHIFYKAFIDCKTPPDFTGIQKGLDWLVKNFGNIINARVGPGPLNGTEFYFLYGVERVGLASGYKYFGTNDWYKMGTQWLLATQSPAGGWVNGIGGPDVSNAFALLFLCRGRNAVVFNKLCFPSVDAAGKENPSDWNCRPRDLANLTEFLSQDYESTVNWQIINLDVDVADWHDAPILYIAGSIKPKLQDKDINKLRDFVLQGGTIFSCTECKGTETFGAEMRKVYKKMFPQYELTALAPDHELYTKKINKDLKGKPKFYMVSNGIRPLIIHTDEDLPKDWQLTKTSLGLGTFNAAANVYMYVTDKASLRVRTSHTWPEAAAGGVGNLSIVRLKWKGNWDPEPLALERFSRLFTAQTGNKLTVQAPCAVDKVILGGANVAILSGAGTLTLNNRETAALKDFVQRGGLLLVDAAGGDRDFAISAQAILESMYGEAAVRRLALASPVYNNTLLPDGKIDQVKYRNKTQSRVGQQQKEPMLKAVVVGQKGVDRVGVIFSREDITNAGLVGYQCYTIDGYGPGEGAFDGSAYRIMRNIMLYAGASGAEVTPAKAAPAAPAKANP